MYTKKHSSVACRPIPPGKKVIFRTWKTLPDGRVVYAWQYGLKAFRLVVDIDE